jgi:competence protein ComEC
MLARALGALLAAPLVSLAAARGRLFPFAPVFIALGIGLYFALPVEPRRADWGLVLGAGLTLAALSARGPEAARPLALAAALVALGLGVAGWRAHSVAAPVLDWRYYGPVEGRIVAIDRSVSDAMRLTLDQVVLRDLPPARTPERVRVSIHGGEGMALDIDPEPGLRVILTAHLGPPGGPVEPGGFDFRRHAWFDRLGAVGYTRSPVLALEPAAEDWALAITRLRMRMSAGIRARIAGEPGGFVAAILTGDRSGVGLATTDALRRSNLAHVLAISGLHMGLLTGVVYGALRGGLALFPLLALRLPIRKLAALGALAAASFYLLLSGGNVATQRAFVMAAVMLGAILLDRRALSLRSVALAAILILLWRPEALLSPGFQMSFAATVALVAVFQTLRRRRARAMAARTGRGERRRLPAWLAGLGGIALCSLVAGLATAPVAAAHFHRVADYGLLANLLSMPLMGTVVMPGAVIAAALWPLGLEGPGLWMMEMGTRWILGVAHWVGALDGAVRPVQAPPAWVLPAVALGMLWLILWPDRARVLGALVALAAMGGWTLAERPVVLIAETGGLIGVMTPEGRALSRPRGDGFIARNWLEADGDAAEQAGAGARLPSPDGRATGFTVGDQTFVQLAGTRAPERLAEVCAAGVTVVANVDLPRPAPGPCRLLDPADLARTGSLAAYRGASGLFWVTAHDRAGDRPWTRAVR